MVKILIVEDDENIARMIEANIAMTGYDTEICDNGLEAVDRIMQGSFDLVLLDVMLPGIDGFEVMKRVENKGVPVIFLTALQDVQDKVKGLHLGAEDYIVKPFEAVELLARIEVVLRRSNKGRNNLTYEDIEIDMEKHTVFQGGEKVIMTPKEFDVLALFMSNIDILITRERLLAEVWGYDFVGESRTVDIHVQKVRRKLNLQNKLITIPKLGYRLESR